MEEGNSTKASMKVYKIVLLGQGGVGKSGKVYFHYFVFLTKIGLDY